MKRSSLTLVAPLALLASATSALAQNTQPAASPPAAAGPAMPAPQASPTAPAPSSQPPQAAQEPSVQTPSPTLAVINNAKLGDVGAADAVSPAILRAEVMLDRLHASPGVIDGKKGANFVHALAIFKNAKHLKDADALDAPAWDALTAQSGAPVLIEYVLTEEDVRGPFYPDRPSDYAQLAKLPSIGYRSISQKIGAKFHMGEDLLAALNPGVDMTKPGGKILVADITPAPLHEKVMSIIVDKAKSQVLGFDKGGTLLVAYPATIGSEELPSPSGSYRVRGIAYNPAYYYDPKNFLQGNNKGKLKLPPGPNNPVGAVFMALTKPTYGLHGTPDPSKIDKTASHGCVRMTNWDATELAHLIKRGIVVRFKG